MLKILTILTYKPKRKLMIDSITWAARCYFKGMISFKSAASHINSVYWILAGNKK